MNFDKRTFTYGFEFEAGDVRRCLEIPSRLGKWEYAEADIVNERPPYRGICADPAGIDPPVGGEVNTTPTRGWAGQVYNILQLVSFFNSYGCPPTSPFTTHNHCHVHVPGLIESPEGLKRLIKYVGANQHDFVETCYRYHELPEMKEVPAARTYLKLDGARMMPDWRVRNIYENTTDFDSFILQHCTGKDAKTRCRPIRTAINTYCLKHVKTIEFRCFRGSFDIRHLTNCFYAVELFVDAALNDGPPWRQLYAVNQFEQDDLPPMKFDLELAKGWQATKKKTSDVSGKNREFIAV